ncbi:hypothetical protein FHR22_002004 [Sphingopyxis panaciterrae]|uniref:hypothetical protein n=1 Tax=Sphingopyxis panaciterrae TaxID=363841 RepID=UPI001420A1EE|nr:hypothetical protein [Sphingopyxis panaciterrae]NIJ37320.1 hypothetical protein [Sphingopyxis panaciterrae]
MDIQAWNRLRPDDTQLRAKLTSWLIDQRRAGEEWPSVTADVLSYVESQRPLRVSERIDRFFLYLSSVRLQPGMDFDLTHSDISTLDWIGAWIESQSNDQTLGFLKLLEGAGLISWNSSGSIEVTYQGFERLDAIETGVVNSRQGFVAMWFGTEMTEAYQNGFAAGISNAGFRPFRIDQKEHSNKIDDEIIAEIRKSRFVVADFTCSILLDEDGKLQPNSRGGVYYEAGFAQGIGIPVIWTVRADCLNYVHFDTRQFAHIVWNGSEDLRMSLTNRISAIIG